MMIKTIFKYGLVIVPILSEVNSQKHTTSKTHEKSFL